MKSLINELEHKISCELFKIESVEQQHYIIGLSDALEMAKEHNKYQVGKIYYVVIPQDMGEPIVEKMKLYRINQTQQKKSYCFTKQLKATIPNPDLVLNNESSLKNKGSRNFRRSRDL